ncbi:Aldo/keto reductase, partial [Atractiella rhizophila]
MGMSAYYGERDDERSKHVLRKAIELGCTFWDTAGIFGQGHNEKLFGEVLAEGDNRSKVFLATKFGNDWNRETGERAGVNGSADYVRKAITESIERLGTNPDLVYLHRVDPNVPIEETIGAMDELRKQGKFKYIGISECAVATLRRAAKVTKIDAVQFEYSPWSTHIEKDGIRAACEELGIPIVAYAPLGRGFLTGKYKSSTEFSKGDFRADNPRF